MKHKILTLIGKNCITPGDGQKVYDLVYPELLAQELKFLLLMVVRFPQPEVKLGFW
jgi:hypothetical protein